MDVRRVIVGFLPSNHHFFKRSVFQQVSEMEDFVDFKVAGGDLLEGPGRGVFFSFFYRWAKQGVEFQVGTWEGVPDMTLGLCY